MLEKEITRRIKGALIKEGAMAVKIHGSPALAGVSDLLCCYRGRFYALEVKRPETRGTVTPRQQAFLDSVESAGGVSAVVTSVDEALAVIGGH